MVRAKDSLKVRVLIDNDPEELAYIDYYHIVKKIPNDEYCGLKIRSKELMNKRIVEGDNNYYYWRIVAYDLNSWDNTIEDYNDDYEFTLAIRKKI